MTFDRSLSGPQVLHHLKEEGGPHDPKGSPRHGTLGLQILSYSCSYMSGFPSLFRVLLHIGQQETGIFQEVFLKLKSLSVRRIRPTQEQGFLVSSRVAHPSEALPSQAERTR